MGWASGVDIMDAVINGVKPVVPSFDDRKKIYEPIYRALTDGDWDTVDEAMGKDEAFDEIARADGWGENGWDDGDD